MCIRDRVPERHKYFERMLNCSRAKSRLAIALSLNGIKCERAIEQLIQLSSDKDPDVRNWATFGLREASSDSPNLCDALFDRCSDSHCETCLLYTSGNVQKFRRV